MKSSVAERLRAFIREQRPGGCSVLSQGAACECPLCDVDRLLQEIEDLKHELTEIMEQR